jgi:hypothetical protein
VFSLELKFQDFLGKNAKTQKCKKRKNAIILKDFSESTNSSLFELEQFYFWAMALAKMALGKMTIGIMTFNIRYLNIMTLRRMTHSIMALDIMTQPSQRHSER